MRLSLFKPPDKQWGLLIEEWTESDRWNIVPLVDEIFRRFGRESDRVGRAYYFWQMNPFWEGNRPVWVEFWNGDESEVLEHCIQLCRELEVELEFKEN